MGNFLSYKEKGSVSQLPILFVFNEKRLIFKFANRELESTMVPPELAWIVPVIVPFIIGLLVGFIIKRTVKLIFLIIALVIVLVATGLVSFTFQDVFNKAAEFLPKIIEMGGGLKNLIPYSSLTFLIGLALGLWKG